MIDIAVKKMDVKTQALILFGILIISILLRWHGINSESMFMDEIRQVGYYKEPFSDMPKYARDQQQPPLDYWIGHLIFRINDSDIAARMPAVLFGSVSVILLTIILSQVVSPFLAFSAAILFSLLPFNLYFSQEARPYAISICLFLLYFSLIANLINKRKGEWYEYALLSMVTSLFLLSRALSPLIMVLSSLCFLTLLLLKQYVNRKSIIIAELLHNVKIMFSLIIACLIYLPFFLSIIDSGKRFAQTGTDIGVDMLLKGFQDFQIMELWQAYLVQAEPLGYLFFFVGLLLFVLMLLKKVKMDRTLSFSLFLLFFGIFLHGFIFFAKTDYHFRPPYAIYILPLVFIIFFILIDRFYSAWLLGYKNIVSMAIVILMVAAVLYVLPHSISVYETKTKTDWRGISELIKEKYSQGHVLIYKSILDKGMWEPGNYGFKRYDENHGNVSWLTVDYLQKNLPELQAYRAKPVLIIFQYRDYFLTQYSPYPFMKAGYLRNDIDLKKLLNGENLELRQFNGLTVVTLKSSTGHFLTDTMVLFNQVLKELPVERVFNDMYHTMAMITAFCGSNNYAVFINLIKGLDSNRLSNEQLEQIETLYQDSQTNQFSCFR